jgi:hypothetical protein
MKRVKILKDMPFAKKGTVMDCDWCTLGLKDSGHSISLQQMIDDGIWLEEVEEEKSLEEEFNAYRFKEFGDDARLMSKSDTYKDYYKGLAQIARKHENKRYLEVFEKCLKDNSLGCSNYPLNYIRQAIEKAGEVDL